MKETRETERKQVVSDETRVLVTVDEMRASLDASSWMRTWRCRWTCPKHFVVQSSSLSPDDERPSLSLPFRGTRRKSQKDSMENVVLLTFVQSSGLAHVDRVERSSSCGSPVPGPGSDRCCESLGGVSRGWNERMVVCVLSRAPQRVSSDPSSPSSSRSSTSSMRVNPWVI